jgi:hypothetical protein
MGALPGFFNAISFPYLFRRLLTIPALSERSGTKERNVMPNKVLLMRLTFLYGDHPS